MNYVRQVIALAGQRRTLADIAQTVGIPLDEVEYILQDPSGAMKSYQAALNSKRDLLYKIRTARPQQDVDNACCPNVHCKYSQGLPCVGPVCWREVLGPHAARAGETGGKKP